MLTILAKPEKTPAVKMGNGPMAMDVVSIVVISAVETIVARVTMKVAKVMVAHKVKMVKMVGNAVDAIIHASDAIDHVTMPIAMIR